MKDDIDDNEDFDIYMKICKVLGYAPSNSFLYRIYSFCVMFLGNACTLSILIDMWLYLGDLEHVMMSARIGLPLSISTCIDIFIKLRNYDMREVIKHSTNFTTIDSGTGALIPKFRYLVTRGFPLAYSIHCLFTIITIITKDGRPLAMNSWFPYDTSYTPVYQFTVIAQIVATGIHTYRFVVFLGIYFTLVMIACSQLEQLRALILGNMKNSQIELNQCIRYHQRILEFINHMEDVFNITLLSQLLFIMGSVCFSAFSIVNCNGNTELLGEAIVTIVVMLEILFIYCWSGEQLMQKSKELEEAIWESNWVGAPVVFQQCVLFVGAASSKELKFTAGKFVPMSNNTMLNILQSCYSYLMCLMSMSSE
ncbi:Odorant receptor 91 [Blattella germanica]|nr:Odorant receptor 91 [Blattella germanica]